MIKLDIKKLNHTTFLDNARIQSFSIISITKHISHFTSPYLLTLVQGPDIDTNRYLRHTINLELRKIRI